MLNHQQLLAEVARAYDVAPLFHPCARRAWDDLADETMAHAARVTSWLDVVLVNESEPYPDEHTMFADIERGRLFVSDLHHEHPVWSPEVNRAFRIVHDVMGHWMTGSDFSWSGELRAWWSHDDITESVHARAALFTEAVGQVAWRIVHGHFGPQKVVVLPTWLRWSVPMDADVAEARYAEAFGDRFPRAEVVA